MELHEILALDFKSAYKLLLAMEDKYPEDIGDVLPKVRYGFVHKFDIYSVFNGYVVEKPKQGKMFIGRRAITQDDFHTELEKREAAVKKVLISLLTDLDILSPRG